MSNHTGAILLAAGVSRRMGGVDKVWADVCGRPLLALSLERLAAVDGIEEIVVVAPGARHIEIGELAFGLGVSPKLPLRCVDGGERRRDSVAAGLAALPDARWVLVHDSARPLASSTLASRALEAARETGAAVPGLPVADTIKRVDAEGLVRETPDRASLRAIQTPQAFDADLLRRAHATIEGDATDDAALVEQLGAPVRVIEGEAQAFKVTTAEDLERLRALLADGGAAS